MFWSNWYVILSFWQMHISCGKYILTAMTWRSINYLFEFFLIEVADWQQLLHVFSMFTSLCIIKSQRFSVTLNSFNLVSWRHITFGCRSSIRVWKCWYLDWILFHLNYTYCLVSKKFKKTDHLSIRTFFFDYCNRYLVDPLYSWTLTNF